MQVHLIKIGLGSFILSSLLLAGCGGSGGGSASSSETLSGVASFGAPIDGGSLSILSLSNGAIFSPTSTTGADGTFSLAIDKAAYPPPYLIKVIDSRTGKSVYSFAANTQAGTLVTPLSTAAISLAFDSPADDAFGNATLLSASKFSEAANLIYTAAKSIFDGLSVTSGSQLLQDATYSADGTGADSILDILSINSTSATSGNLLVTPKFPGPSIEITTASNASTINSININASLAASILVKINATNQNCFVASVLANSANQFTNCVDSGFNESGKSADSFFADVIKATGNQISVAPASLNWCMFNNTSLNFSSAITSVANQSGVCEAILPIKVSGSNVIPVPFRYSFTASGSGNTASTVRMLGNKFNDTLSVYPAISKKIRVDGTPSNQGNQGLVSGYRVDIGTALGPNDTVTNDSNISAIVEIIDAGSSSLGKFYMQCTQSAGSNPLNCRDSSLSFCIDNSPTCSAGPDVNNRVDKVGTGIIPINSATSTNIISALKSGPVYLKVATFNTTLDQVTINTNPLHESIVPIVGTPISMSDAASIKFPSITNESMNTLAEWTGSSTLSLDFNHGNVSVYNAWFNTSVNGSGQELFVKQNTKQLNFTKIGAGETYASIKNTSTPIALTWITSVHFILRARTKILS